MVEKRNFFGFSFRLLAASGLFLINFLLTSLPISAADNNQQNPPALAEMSLIPAGEFIMGMEGSANKTPHSVHLDGFYMDKREVTQEQYEKMRGSNPSKFKGGNLPVEQVTWYEANAYCMQVGKRLPTEAEWEKAARAGSQTAYAWGAEMNPDYAWFKENSNETTHAVGEKKPNAFELYDMNGNVWEWVADWYDKRYYESSPRKNPKGPDHGEEKVIRGGSWYSGDRHLLSATRYWSQPSVRNSNFGFRCARDAN